MTNEPAKTAVVVFRWFQPIYDKNCEYIPSAIVFNSTISTVMAAE